MRRVRKGQIGHTRAFDTSRPKYLIEIRFASVPDVSLPLTVEEATPEWVVAALAPSIGDQLVGARLVEATAGTADKLIFALEYAAEDARGNVPESVCVKAGLNEVTRALVADGYIAESRFFDEIAPALEAPVPRCWYAAADAQARQGIVIQDDLGHLGCRFGDPLTGLSVDEVASGLAAQATWHAATWNERGLDRYGWLGRGSQTVIDFYAACLAQDEWNASLSRLTTEQMPGELRDRERIGAALHAAHQLNEHGPRVLAHGDAHIGNTYVMPDSTVGFLDWQTVSRGNWADDVAYFLVGSLSLEDRRASEFELLDHYVEHMVARGVAREDLGDVRATYRRQHLHGFFWGLLPPGYQPQERCGVMCQRYSAAMLEHDTLGALHV
jgi:hypothetical protein